MVGDREFGVAIHESLHRFSRIHVLVAHEPARLVGADRQNGEPQRSVALARAAEISAVAVAGIANKIDSTARRLDHKRRPQ
jgi:hypothetical protein